LWICFTVQSTRYGASETSGWIFWSASKYPTYQAWNKVSPARTSIKRDIRNINDAFFYHVIFNHSRFWCHLLSGITWKSQINDKIATFQVWPPVSG
jgi:hypothetical protein